MRIIKTAHIREVYKKFPDASHSKLAEELDKVAKKEIYEAVEKMENRYAISLVFRKAEYTREVILLRSLTTNATSEEEALGKALKYFDEETEGYALGMKTVIPANDKDYILTLKEKYQ